MSMSTRPVSLQAALALRRAQVAREQAAAKVPVRRRTGFSLARIFGTSSGDVGSVEEVEPRKLAA